ncbi:MAG TPA: glycosyltransferase family 39 protein [Planctomycetota bacterium]|nr:glycosyltransferase family 39 protein [Planctomycetota bacterium]
MRTAVVLFVFALAMRLLFWVATPDRGGAWSVCLQGDAPLWQQLADKVATGQPDELLLLPLRPPGMQWLVTLLWNGDAATAWRLRLLFVVLGAAIAPLVWLLLRAHVAPAVAAFAAGLCAACTNLIVLGSGLHSELPYLVLFLLTLFVQERLHARPAIWLALTFGALHAAGCLLRAEHALTFVPLLALLAWQRAPRWHRSTLVAASSFVLCLVPWHLVAWSSIDTYNVSGALPLPDAGALTPRGLPWDRDAIAAVRQLPGFQQWPITHFVEDTVAVRGGHSVRAADLEIVREAYGCWPEALPHAFVCLYGGLNFFLGNSREADGGFSQQALDRAPPLAGGDARYPPGLRQVLPHDGQLALSYPPHLDLLVHGYRRGLAELWADPIGGAARIGTKLWHGLEGAAGGLGSYALPIGLSGVRRPVDMVTAEGAWPAIFRLGWLAVALAGLWPLRRERFLAPWLVFAATKVVVLMAFFGYARQGTLCIPLLSLGIAAAWHRWLLPRWPWTGRARTAAVVAVVLLALELVRCSGTGVSIDSSPVTGAPPPTVDHSQHRVSFR